LVFGKHDTKIAAITYGTLSEYGDCTENYDIMRDKKNQVEEMKLPICKVLYPLTFLDEINQ
jgi:hypothetical protein